MRQIGHPAVAVDVLVDLRRNDNTNSGVTPRAEDVVDDIDTRPVGQPL